MSEKKYQVFISSTYSDLAEERRKILDVLLMADCIPAGMEAFVATDDEQFAVIKKVIDLCDYYILLIGKRYGSVNPLTELSYTEMEYLYAKEKGIPVLVFALDESVNVAPEKTENNSAKIEKLKRFRDDALLNRLVSTWKTSDELTGKVAISIMKAKSEIERLGWQRGTDFDEASLRREIMELQTKNEELVANLSEKDEIIKSFTEQSDIAFDDCEIDINYQGYSNFDHEIKTVPLKDIFAIIALEMMDVALDEYDIQEAIKSQLLGSTHCFFIDRQLTKRLLIQFKALGFIYRYWDNEKSCFFWDLTQKGTKVRDDSIVIKIQPD